MERTHRDDYVQMLHPARVLQFTAKLERNVNCIKCVYKKIKLYYFICGYIIIDLFYFARKKYPKKYIVTDVINVIC